MTANRLDNRADGSAGPDQPDQQGAVLNPSAKEETAKAADVRTEVLRSDERLELASQGLLVAYEKVARAEREHRAAVQVMWLERNNSERELRRSAADREDRIRQESQENLANAALLQAELARMTERANQFDERLRTEQRIYRTSKAQFDQRLAQLDEELHAVQVRANRAIEEREEFRAIAMRADGIIRSAAQSGSSRLRHLAQFFGARDPEAIEALANWSFPLEPLCPTSDQATARAFDDSSKLRPSDRVPITIEELLSRNDREFVECAYQLALAREADTQGADYYVQRLRRGHSKVEILWQLRSSEEGRQRDPAIPKFDETIWTMMPARLRWKFMFQRNKLGSPRQPAEAIHDRSDLEVGL